MATPTANAPRKSSGMMFTLLTIGIAFAIIFYEPLRTGVAKVLGFVLTPTIGFGGKYPLLTIFIAGVLLVVATTVVRHFMTDWTKMARMQEAMRTFGAEMKDARKSNNTYKLKKLTESQADLMQLQADAQMESFKPMGITMILAIPIFAWLGVFLGDLSTNILNPDGTSTAVLYLEAPWNSRWNIMANYDWMGGDNNGWFPRWIVLYSLFGIPFGQIAQRALKLWEYRHVDLDGDGKPAGKQA